MNFKDLNNMKATKENLEYAKKNGEFYIPLKKANKMKEESKKLIEELQKDVDYNLNALILFEEGKLPKPLFKNISVFEVFELVLKIEKGELK